MLNLARNLDFIGVFGLQVAFNYRDTLLIEDLRRNGIKLYMLNGEDKDNVSTDCNAMNLLEGFTEPIEISGETERQVEESLKSCLKEVLKRRLEKRQSEDFTSIPQDDPLKRNHKKSKKESSQKTVKTKKFSFLEGRKKFKKNSLEKEHEKKNNEKFEYEAADVDKVKETNVLFFEGK